MLRNVTSVTIFARECNNHTQLSKFVLIILILIIGLPARVSGAVRMHTLSTDDGLSDMLVNCIFKDSRGYLWLGTGVGLDRYDGNNVHNFAFGPEVVEPRRITAIAETPGGRIVVGGFRGLSVVSDGMLMPWMSAQINFRVYDLLSDGSSRLYIATARGLYIYDESTGKLSRRLIRRDVLMGDNEITALARASDGALWMATQSYIHHFDPATGRDVMRAVGADGRICAMVDMGDCLVIGVYGTGALIYDKQADEIFRSPLIGNNLVTAICRDPADARTLYVSTDGEGIYKVRIDNMQARVVGALDGLRSKSVYSMLVDDRGVLWVGYYQSGVGYTPYCTNIFEVYSYGDLFDSHGLAVRAVAVDGRRKFVGTREGLYYIDEESERVLHYSTPRIRSNLIFCITPYRGKYYIGTFNGGMYVLDPASGQLDDFAPGRDPFVSGSVFAIAIGPDESMWVGTGRGLFRFREGRPDEHYKAGNSHLPDDTVYEIFFDSAGRGWICTERGMAVWNGTSLQTERFPAGFVNEMKIRDVYESPEHRLYFAPDRGPVFSSDLALTDFGFESAAEELKATATSFVTHDGAGSLFYGTDKGLIHVGRNGRQHWFGISEGLPDQVFTLCQPYTDSRGRIWLGNSSGLVSLNPARLAPALDELNTPPVITDLRINGRSLSGLGRYRLADTVVSLSGDESALVVEYSDFRYADPHNSRVQYKIDGIDAGWRLATGGRPLEFFNLPTGKSVLRMRQPGNPDTEVRLHIRRAASLGWAAYALIVAVLLLIGGSVYLVARVRRHRRQMAAAEQIISSATHAEEEKKRNLYRTSRLSEEECRRILRSLDGIMKAERPYANPDLKISQLAAMAGRNGHELSFLFNQYLDKSFYDYVNEYRVAEFKRLAAEGASAKYTLTAMAERCGFSSRASFFRHFKAHTGQTPAEYLKGLGADGD